MLSTIKKMRAFYISLPGNTLDRKIHNISLLLEKEEFAKRKIEYSSKLQRVENQIAALNSIVRETLQKASREAVENSSELKEKKLQYDKLRADTQAALHSQLNMIESIRKNAEERAEQSVELMELKTKREALYKEYKELSEKLKR